MTPHTTTSHHTLSLFLSGQLKISRIAKALVASVAEPIARMATVGQPTLSACVVEQGPSLELRIVNVIVFVSRHQLQIFWAVIVTIMIEVMHMLVAVQWTTQYLLYDPSMLSHPDAWFRDLYPAW